MDCPTPRGKGGEEGEEEEGKEVGGERERESDEGEG